MKLSILCDAARTPILPPLRVLFDEIFIETRAWISPVDGDDPVLSDELDSSLAYSTDALVFPASNGCDDSWIYYVLGYAAGANLALGFHRDSTTVPSPPHLVRFPFFTGALEELADYYGEKATVWERKTSVDVARSALVDREQDNTAAAFIRAVEEGDRFLTGLYLDAGWDPSMQNDRGVPLLNLAVRAGHGGLVEPLREAGAKIDIPAEDRKTTPLMDAAGNGYTDLVGYFASRGADLDAVNRDGQSAVTLAAGNGREEAAVLLVEAGADVDIPDNLGMSARKYATLYSRKKILAAIAARE